VRRIKPALDNLGQAMRSDPPDPRTASGPVEFVERLRELRLWAGQPPLRRLRQLGGTTVDASGVEIDALPVSTTSYVLRGDRLPRMEFVRAYVAACLRARQCGGPEFADYVERWHEGWLRLQHQEAPPARTETPRQLPPDVAGFTGRAGELAELHKLVAQAREPGQPALAVIHGAGGVGKSTLAVHAAHQLAAHFPDGQLYADLHGATVGLDPLSPLEVLNRFLRALGTRDSQIPDQLDEAAAAFRTAAADRRLLFLLDNATDERQVRSLLPAASGCWVLVTSRQALVGLDAASHLHLAVLPEQEAVSLLGRVVGQERVTSEPAAAAELTLRCGYLPLALRIAGARLAARPGWPVAALAERLADQRRRLDELQVADTGVRASIDVSFRQLHDSTDPADREAARAFGLLGIWDGPDLALPVASRLLDRPEPDTERSLERLVVAALLETRAADRYRLHDLLRLYAREHANRTYPAFERVAALRRALRFYTATSWRTLALLRPGDRRHDRGDDRWRAGGRQFADVAEALAWLEIERPNLLAAADQAGAIDELAPAAVQIAQALFGFFNVSRRWHDLAEVNQIALRVAHDVGDSMAEARAYNDLGVANQFRGRFDEALRCHRRSLAIRREHGDDEEAGSLENLGTIHRTLGQHDEATACLRRSLAIRRAAGDRHGEASCLTGLGVLSRLLDRYDEATGFLRESLSIAEELSDLEGQANNLNSLGTVYLHLGRHRDALDCLWRSVRLCEALGHRYGVAAALDTIGTIEHMRGRYAEAFDCYRQSLAGMQDLGSRPEEAEVLRNAGVALHALGRFDEARGHWEKALAISEELGLPTEELRGMVADGWVPATPSDPHPA
jgi:tetratricopeptide (TPR) repeat protein